MFILFNVKKDKTAHAIAATKTAVVTLGLKAKVESIKNA
jgi:hypothetical protein